MAGVDLKAIHEALADQLKANLADDWNTAAFPFSGMEWPLVEVWPAPTGYIGYWGSFGESGVADIAGTLQVYVAANTPEDYAERVWEVLSVGTGHGNSVVDAVMVDRTLGGTVADIIVRRGDWTPTNDDPGAPLSLPFEIKVAKQGAKV